MSIDNKIEAIANTLLPSFIPKNPEEKELSFHFTLPPDTSYQVFFTKNEKSDWQFKRYEEVVK